MRWKNAAANMRSMIPDAGAEPTLSVSIVLHESSPARLKTTLISLHRAVLQARSGGALGAVRVTVLDNGSSDTYRQTLASVCDQLESELSDALALDLLLQPDNPGFGAGHNRAQVGAQEAFLLILNPDVELAEDSLLQALEYLRAEDGVVALNPESRRTDGSGEYLSKRYPSVWTLFLRGAAPGALRRRFDRRLAAYEYRDSLGNDPMGVELLSGACLLCRNGAFQQVGGFDERYFMYFEDFDLSRRLAAIGGLVCLPPMRIIHHGGNAARKGGKHIRWFARSALRFFNQHGWRLK